ncbi:MAG: WecB/TagA/CpsF family glycosyltransferase [Candidatus Cloacimonetes bacterium]|nr:WecB/TagA/CpsF family glycosyltransferase [Candidatus Cloacimonadota bacterium]
MSLFTSTFLGLKISHFPSKQDLMDELDSVIKTRKTIDIHSYSLTIFYLFQQMRGLFPLHQESDIQVCDGKGFYFLMKLLGFNNYTYFPIPDIVLSCCELADKKGYSVMLLGATQESNDEATRRLRKKYPDANILDGLWDYWGEQNDEKAIALINELKPDILCVGISSPKKELFAHNCKKRVDSRIIIHSGATIDFISGKENRPPRFFQHLSLWWLWRVFQDPKKLVKQDLVNGLKALFILVPRILWEVHVKGNYSFSIPRFLKVDDD